MFEGTITYNVGTEFNGNIYHMNFKKLVCFVSQDYYKEEFWADKKNKYFIRIFDFKKGLLSLINIRHKTLNQGGLAKTSDLVLEEIKVENSQSIYKLIYDVDFGFKTSSKYTYKTDTRIYLNPKFSSQIRICSKIPIGNNEVASYFKEEPKFRYRNTKEYNLIGIIPKKLKTKEFELSNFKGFELTTDKLNRVIHNEPWKNTKWEQNFKRTMINFYQQELKINLTKEQQDNIGAYSSTYFGLMDEDDYRITQKRLREFEKKYPYKV